MTPADLIHSARQPVLKAAAAPDSFNDTSEALHARHQ